MPTMCCRSPFWIGCDLSTSVILNITASDCWDLATLAFPPFAYDTQYYVVALAGNDIGTGVVDLGDPNLSVSDCVPFILPQHQKLHSPEVRPFATGTT